MSETSPQGRNKGYVEKSFLQYKCQYKNVHFWPYKDVQFTHS